MYNPSSNYLSPHLNIIKDFVAKTTLFYRAKSDDVQADVFPVRPFPFRPLMVWVRVSHPVYRELVLGGEMGITKL